MNEGKNTGCEKIFQKILKKNQVNLGNERPSKIKYSVEYIVSSRR